MTEAARINFIPPQWKIPRYSIDINMTGNVTQFSSCSHISLGFKRHFLTTDIGKTQSSYFYRWSISLWNDRTSTDVTFNNSMAYQIDWLKFLFI